MLSEPSSCEYGSSDQQDSFTTLVHRGSLSFSLFVRYRKKGRTRRSLSLVNLSVALICYSGVISRALTKTVIGEGTVWAMRPR